MVAPKISYLTIRHDDAVKAAQRYAMLDGGARSKERAYNVWRRAEDAFAKEVRRVLGIGK